jgi:hypothetical protein
LHGFALILGSSTLTICTNYLITQHKATGSLAAALTAAGAAVARRSLGNQVLLALCGVAALYTFAYQTVVTYSTLSSIYYSIFPKEDSEDTDSSIDISSLPSILITI